VVVVDELGHVGERRVEFLVERVVEAGTAVKEDDRRTLSHGRSVRNEFGPVDINKQPNVTNRHEHYT
jgi:hypothetical protein